MLELTRSSKYDATLRQGEGQDCQRLRKEEKKEGKSLEFLSISLSLSFHPRLIVEPHMLKDTQERGFVGFRKGEGASRLPLSAYCISVTSRVLIRQLPWVSSLSLLLSLHPPLFSPVCHSVGESKGEREKKCRCP